MSYHSFDPQVAKQYGVTEAVIIQHFQFWILHNKRNKKNLHETRTWTYNSAKALADTFTYLSAKQIYGAICRLVEAGVLLKNNFNDHKYDRTSWYSFADEEFWTNPPEILHFPAAEKGKDQAGQPIPVTLTSDLQDTLPPDSSALPRGAKEEGKKTEPKKSPEKKQEDKRPPREHWQPFVDTWHQFYKAKKHGEEPTIAGKALADLRKLYDLLQLRARKKQVQGWTEKYLVDAFNFFLTAAYSDDWLSKHFLLGNLVEQFDAVFAREAEKTKGKAPAKPFAEEIQYIIERWNEGDMDARLITPELYKKLEEKKIVPMGYREQFTGKDPDEQKCNAVRGWLDHITKKTATA
jgi:hypothetical protein